jgi:hypothetical protein
MWELWELDQIHRFLAAHSESTLCTTREAISTCTSMLPAKPYRLLTSCSQRRQSQRFLPANIKSRFSDTSKARYTTISLLPARPDCQKSESGHVTAVGPTMSESWELGQIHSMVPDHRASRFSAISETIPTATTLLPAAPVTPLPACWPQCQTVRGESECVRVAGASILVGKVSTWDLWVWAYQRGGRKLVRVVRVSMLAMWEKAYKSHESQRVHKIELIRWAS